MKYLLSGFLLCILLSCSPKLTPSETVPATENTAVSSNMEESILAIINDHRRSRGLSSLQMLNAASAQAYQHSKDMATGKTGFGHDGFEQRVQAIKKTMGAGMMSAWAENVAYGELSSQEVVKGWLNSPPHKKNIEGNYNLTGIGVYKDRQGVLYFTQIFLRK